MRFRKIIVKTKDELDKISRVQAVDITGKRWCHTAIQQELAILKILEACKKSGIGPTKLSKLCGCLELRPLPDDQIDKKVFPFSKQVRDYEFNILKNFLFTEMFWQPDLGKRNCLAFQLGVWKKVWGTDVDLVGQPDPEALFPCDKFGYAEKILPMAKDQEWIFYRFENKERRIFLTPAGVRLKKVSLALKNMESGLWLDY
jgi:hypothetical protein